MSSKLSALVLFMALSFGVQAENPPEIKCDSVGVASCVTSDGMCVDFFEGNMDAEVWEGMCHEMEGEFSESACDKTDVVLSCLNSTNPLMALTHYTADYDLDMAQQMCSMLGGSVCK